MNKWGYILLALYGAFLVITNLIAVANLISNPSDLVLVDIASIVAYLFSVGFGGILVSFYFVQKKKEDQGAQALKPVPNSPEDLTDLGRSRNWVIGMVILYLMISSAQVWILNDYSVGLTLININVIFDVGISIFFAYLLVQLFRNKNVLNQVLYAVILMTVVEGALAFLRLGWLQLLLVAYILPYFVYAIKAPLNRTTFRIAHLFLLPATFLAALVLVYISNTPLNEILKTDSQLMQQYQVQNGITAQSYEIFLQKNPPIAVDMQNVKDAAVKGNKINDDIVVNADKATAEFEKQLPNIVQQKELYHLRNYKVFLELNKSQAEKIFEFVDYADSIDFTNISEKEAMELNNYKNEVDDFNSKIATISFTMSNDLK